MSAGQHKRCLTIRDDDLKRIVEALELRATQFRSTGSVLALVELEAIRHLQNRLDPDGRWCEALIETSIGD